MELSCKFFGNTDDWSNFRSKQVTYTCEIRTAFITEPRTLIKSVNGVHQGGKSNESIDEIRIHNTTVDYFPRGLDKFFPNITHLTMNNCGLKEITRTDLVGFKTLIELSLESNKIQSLPDNLFVGMKNLQLINFSDNKISCASSKLLKPIEAQLKFAWFKRNAKIDVDYSNLTPATLNDLKQHLDKCDNPKNSPRGSVVKMSDFPGSFAKKLELMWKTRKFSDFTILVDKKEFKVHKNILGMQSDFFETMFEQEMEEGLTGKMTIDVFKPEPVEEFLKFFYTGKAPSVVNAMEVFKIATMYEVPELADLSEEIISDNINESNVVDVLRLANIHERDEMKSSCAEFVKLLLSGKHLKDSLFNNCEAIKKIIETKQAYDFALESILNE